MARRAAAACCNVDIVWTDLRLALRALRRTPPFTLASIGTLALGLGLATALFSVYYGILLRPLPYPGGDRLLRLWESDSRRDVERGAVSRPDLADWRRRCPTLSGVAGYRPGAALVGAAGGARTLAAVRATPDLFAVLGVAPRGGPGLAGVLPGERRLVVSDRLWRRRFGGRARPGATLDVDGEPWLVAGVAPPGFSFPRPGVDLWMPLQEPGERGSHDLQVVARMAPGATLRSVRADLARVARQLAGEHPATNAHRGVTALPLREERTGDVRPLLDALLAGVACILAIACANVGNLLLARGLARRRETATHLALGAPRGRLFRQALAESLLLAAAAGVAGLGLAWAGVEAVRRWSHGLPGLDAVAVDLPVFALASGLCLLAALAFAALALAASSRGAPARALRAGRSDGAGRRPLGRLLVAGETALAFVLLAGAALMGRSFLLLAAVDPGFDPRGVLAVELAPPQQRAGSIPSLVDHYRRSLAAVAALPGVRHAGLVSQLPMGGEWMSVGVELSGRGVAGGDEPEVDLRLVSADYFATLRIPLRRGRLPEAGGAGPGAVVVNETMARRFWPGGDALEGRVRVAGSGDPWLPVAGVVGDVHHDGVAAPPRAELYTLYPRMPFPWPRMTLVARGDRPPGELVGAVLGRLEAVDPTVAPGAARPLEEVVAADLADRRFDLLTAGVFSAVAVLLAAAGVYALLAYAVRRRRREIGTRMACGADRAAIVRRVLADGLGPVVAGLAVGLAAALALTRTLSALLYGVAPSDPLALGAAALALGAAGLLACWLPAHRAARTDPMVALRAD